MGLTRVPILPPVSLETSPIEIVNPEKDMGPPLLFTVEKGGCSWEAAGPQNLPRVTVMFIFVFQTWV